MASNSHAFLSQLRDLLDEYFNEEGLRDLCLYLNVDLDNLAGETKKARFSSLVRALARNGRLPDLITSVQQQRPKVAWPPVPDDFELPESLDDGETVVSPNQSHVYGDVVNRDKNAVGNVSGQSVVAVGERARATINRYVNIIIRADNLEYLPPTPGAPPYKGLAYFSTKDKDIFFGREKLSDELADRLQTTHFLAIIGASGSGKSSLLRAGIIPRLEERNWRIHIIKPGAHPLAALAASLTRNELDPAATGIIGEALATNADTLHKTAAILVARAHAERLLLAVDQFEELFTQCRDPQEQQAFVDNLVSAAGAQGAVTVLLSMRADFYGRVSQFPNLPDLISQQQVYIKPMAEEDLVRAIAEPAKRGGWQFVEGLVEQFVADVGNEPGRLPLLSHALLATWERRRGVVMTLGGYREAGGVKSAIAQTAETTYAALTASEQLIAKRIFLRLTELGKGTEDTRRRVSQVELGEGTTVQTVTQRLSDARLITTTQDGIDVAHEALIREWPRLREWLDADREGLIIHRRLTDAEREWRNNKQEPSLLYSGFRLNEAEQWVKDNANVLNDLEQTFFTASIAARQKRKEEVEAQRQHELKQAQALAAEQKQRAEEQTAAAKRLRSRNILFAGAAVVAIMLAFIALFFFGNAQENLSQANVALTAEGIAQAEAANNLALAQTREADAEENLNTANIALIAEATAKVEAVTNLSVAQTREAEAIAANATAEAERNIAQEQAAVAQSRSLASSSSSVGHTDDMRALLLAIASGERANTTQAFDVLQTQLLFMPPRQHTLSHEEWVNGATWNSDESLILTWSGDRYDRNGTAVVWDADSGERQFTLSHEGGSVTGAMWNNDESLILTWGGGRMAVVWDATSGERRHILFHGSWVNGATWNSDESLILTWSDDGTAVVWDATNGEKRYALSHEEWVNGATWNSDESLILTWSGGISQNGTAIVWDANSGERQFTLSNGQEVIGATWNKDEDFILTWGDDGAAVVWDANSGERRHTLYPGWQVNGAKWNSDGNLILTWSGDPYGRNETVVVWDANSGERRHTLSHELLSHEWQINGAAWNSDGSFILTWSNDRTAVVWDANSGERRYTLSHEAWVNGAIWNSDESLILTWSDDGTAVVWDATSGERRYTLSHEERVRGATWNSDGNLILTWSGDGRTVVVWDANSGEQQHTLSHEWTVDGAMWNSDESLVLTWSGDRTAVVWDATNGERQHTLSHESWVNGAMWNSDESLILTWSDDGTVVVWDATSGERRYTLSNEWKVNGAIWNRDESLILTWSGDWNIHNGTAVVWDANSGERQQILSHGQGVIGAAWNSDESLILTWSYDGTAVVWDANSGERRHTFSPLSHEGSVYGAIWNNDESLILTWSGDPYDSNEIAVIWDATSGEQYYTLSHEERIDGATWNSDESLILTWSGDWIDQSGAVVVWDATSGERQHTFSLESSVNGAIWNSDESLILTWSDDGTVVVWDATSGERQHALSHEDRVAGATWNSDESLILTWSNDGTVKIWDAESGQPLRVIYPDSTGISDAKWNQAEDRLLVATGGGIVRIYYTNMDELIAAACQVATRNFNWEEWQLYFPGEPYRQTCPNLPAHPSVPQD